MKDSINNASLLDRRRQQTFDILQDKHQRLVSRDYAQVFAIEKVSMVCLELCAIDTAHSSSPDQGIRLTRRSADQYPRTVATKGGANTLIHNARVEFGLISQFSVPSLSI